MKKFSFLSLIVFSVLVFSLSSCKKAEQPVEAPKPAERLPLVMGFYVTGVALDKAGTGYILSSSTNDKMAWAIKKTDAPFKSIVTVKGRIKAGVPSGTRNGYIAFGENPRFLSKAGILIGGKMLKIEGHFVESVEKKEDFNQDKIFNFELTINLNEKTVKWKVDSAELKAKITHAPASINYLGYGVWQTKTEFSDLEILGK